MTAGICLRSESVVPHQNSISITYHINRHAEKLDHQPLVRKQKGITLEDNLAISFKIIIHFCNHMHRYLLEMI